MSFFFLFVFFFVEDDNENIVRETNYDNVNHININ